MMKIISVQVGLPREVEWEGDKVTTAIFKQAVSGPVRLRRLNLEGDGQADLTTHGGVDKAVYAYSLDAYPWWKTTLGVGELPNGSFGENLTFDLLNETELNLGDVVAIGECRLQVVQPRFPCSKLGIKFRDMGILKTFMKSERPGIYFRVLHEGVLQAGDEARVVETDPEKVPVITLVHLKTRKLSDPELFRRILRVKSLNEEFRDAISARVAALS